MTGMAAPLGSVYVGMLALVLVVLSAAGRVNLGAGGVKGVVDMLLVTGWLLLQVLVLRCGVDWLVPECVGCGL